MGFTRKTKIEHASDAKIPVILSVDVEPDPFLVNRFDPEPWKGYEATHPYLSSLRSRFEEATGSPVHYNWCFRMDPQVAESYGSPTYVVDQYPGFIKEMERQGDGFGTHPHAYRWIEERQTWFPTAERSAAKRICRTRRGWMNALRCHCRPMQQPSGHRARTFASETSG